MNRLMMGIITLSISISGAFGETSPLKQKYAKRAKHVMERIDQLDGAGDSFKASSLPAIASEEGCPALDESHPASLAAKSAAERMEARYGKAMPELKDLKSTLAKDLDGGSAELRKHTNRAEELVNALDYDQKDVADRRERLKRAIAKHCRQAKEAETEEQPAAEEGKSEAKSEEESAADDKGAAAAPDESPAEDESEPDTEEESAKEEDQPLKPGETLTVPPKKQKSTP